MLFTEELLQILEPVDGAVEIDLIDEVMSHLDILNLHFLLRLWVLLSVGLLVNENYFNLRHNINR